MNIYLAGPMHGYPLYNFPAFDRAVEVVSAAGHNAISPAQMQRDYGFNEHSEGFSAADYQNAMRLNYSCILQSDAIAFLDGWEDSTGANLERSFGLKLGLPFYRVGQELRPERIIGFSGFAQSGKDTAASFLTERGWERRAFADPLRSILYALNPIAQVNHVYDEEHRLASLVDNMGWDDAKQIPEIRSLLQRLGTEGGRKHIANDIWTRTLFERQHGPNLVITDARFQNEVDAIHQRNGIVVRVERPGVGPVNGHVSEDIPTGFDYTIINDGSLDDLKNQVLSLVGGSEPNQYVRSDSGQNDIENGTVLPDSVRS